LTPGKSLENPLVNGGFQFEDEPQEKQLTETSLSKLPDDPLEASTPVATEIDKLMTGVMVETAAATIGKLAALITRMPELEFDEDEIDQLKRAWAPLLPQTMSPATAAFLATIVIVGGKVAVYVARRKELNNDEKKRTIENTGSDSASRDVI